MKTEKNRKLKGSVLLTVVSIMALLIVFLTSALVLATASNRRAHRDYSSSQAEYTARAAIDSAIASINQNVNVRAAVQEINAPMYANVSLGNDSLGRLVRTDASGNDVFDQITLEPVLDSGGNIKQVYYYDNNGVTTAWHAYNQIKITATVKVGKERKTVSVYAATTPTSIVPQQTPSNLQGLQTAGGAGFTTTAGNITGALNMGLLDSAHGDYTIYNDTVLHEVENFVNGSFNSSGGGIYLDIMSPNSKTTFLGDLTVGNHTEIKINYSGSAPQQQQDVPYLFVEGRFKVTGDVDVNVGASSSNQHSQMPFNIFAGTCELKQLYLAGDLYLMDDTGSSVIGSWQAEGSHLYSWTESMSGSNAQFSSSGGNIYCKGDVEFRGKTSIPGDVRSAGTVIITNAGSNDLHFYGKIVANHVIIRGDTNKKIQVDGGIFCNTYEITRLDHEEDIVHPYWTEELRFHNDAGEGETAGPTAVTGPTTVHGIVFDTIANSGVAESEIYPSAMTKEEIYGHQIGDGWSISSDPAAPNYSPNKIIKNIVELRNALHYDATNGVFDETVYINQLGSNILSAIADDSAHPVKWSTLGSPEDINNVSCQSAYDNNVLVLDTNVNKQLNIKVDANDSIVIVIEDGVDIQKPIIVDAPSNVQVPFFINGKVKVTGSGGGCIVTKAIYDRVSSGTKEIYEWDSINITMYAKKNNASIEYYNNGLICANAMAPTLSLRGDTTGGGTSLFSNLAYYEGASAPGTRYTSSHGDLTFNPHWIGNAFVGGIDPNDSGQFSNNFTLLYTRNGNNGGNPPPGGQNTVPMYYERFFAEY